MAAGERDNFLRDEPSGTLVARGDLRHDKVVEARSVGRCQRDCSVQGGPCSRSGGGWIGGGGEGTSPTLLITDANRGCVRGIYGIGGETLFSYDVHLG